MNSKTASLIVKVESDPKAWSEKCSAKLLMMPAQIRSMKSSKRPRISSLVGFSHSHQKDSRFSTAGLSTAGSSGTLGRLLCAVPLGIPGDPP